MESLEYTGEKKPQGGGAMGHSAPHGAHPSRHTMGGDFGKSLPLGWFGEAESTLDSATPSKSVWGDEFGLNSCPPPLVGLGKGRDRPDRSPIRRGRGALEHFKPLAPRALKP
jgi:hypothetical protein